MQRTHSSNSHALFLMLAIALFVTTFSSAQAQTTNEKSIQTPERVGVDTADALPLSLNEAIKLALENNNDIRTSRIDVEKAEHNLTARRGAYDPQLFSEAYFERSSTPVASFLGGNNNGSLEQKDFTNRIGMSGLAPKGGGSYRFEEKKNWVLEISGLEGKGDLLTGSLPGGWKQRVAFGAAVMHEPSVLFLDEPTSGVDPLARRAFWKMINSFADRGVAVLVTTHYLEEAEQCNRLGFMVAGELVAEGTPSGVKAAQGGHLLELITDEPQAAADLLKKTRERWRISLFGDRLHVVVDTNPNEEIIGLTKELAASNIDVFRAYETPYSLEDVFISVVEKARKAN